MERLEKNIEASRQFKLVPPDKFDRHMRKARLNDITNRQTIFSIQTEDDERRRNERMKLNPSTY